MGKLSLLGDESSPLRALSACGQILHKNPGKGQTLPIPAMPGFWEFLFLEPLPNAESKMSQYYHHQYRLQPI